MRRFSVTSYPCLAGKVDLLMQIPRIVISGLSGGTGKSMVSLGLTRHFYSTGQTTRTFKKGPDYIDAAWMALASNAPAGTLDPFFSTPDELLNLFTSNMQGYSLGIIEGNRGLFDGLDLAGSCSTANLACTLKAPVILVVNCTKMTRTAAALVHGCRTFDPNLTLGGVILNMVGTSRQEGIIRDSIETLTGVPVLGCLPRLEEPLMHEDRMGGLLCTLAPSARQELDRVGRFVADHVDTDKVLQIATGAPALPNPAPRKVGMQVEEVPGTRPVIGVVRDEALWYYYEENLNALRRAGADLAELSLLGNAPWPHIDGLYLGGGQPEAFAAEIAANGERRQHIHDLALAGLPVYAEGGGFNVLSREMVIKGTTYPMCGVFPHSVVFTDRPLGLGYTEGFTLEETPFYPKGTQIRGHEFHLSRCWQNSEITVNPVLGLTRGKGLLGVSAPESTPYATPDRPHTGFDGLHANNAFGCYTHIFAPAVPHWAENFVALCR